MNHNVCNLFRTPDCNTNTVVGAIGSNDSYAAVGIAYIADSTTKYNLFIWESFDLDGYVVNTTKQ